MSSQALQPAIYVNTSPQYDISIQLFFLAKKIAMLRFILMTNKNNNYNGIANIAEFIVYAPLKI